MKTLTTLLSTLAVVIVATQTASATPLTLIDGNKVKLDRVGTFGGTTNTLGAITNAGAFRTVGNSATTVAAGFGNSFQTFCLERTETIALNTAYYVDIDTAAKNGGFGGSVAGADPLSYSTAWLYTQFRNGTLDDGLFGISGFSYNANASMDALQLAFWKLEDELDSSWLTRYNSSALAKSLVTAATASGWTSLGDVRVMNLYSNYSLTGGFSGAKQSQLYLMPVPEPETYAMLLAGLGLMGAVARRRNRQAA